jgi:putative transposase
MRKRRFTDEQIVAIVREAESGARATEVCRRHGVSKETLRRWRAKYRGMELQEAKRLKALEEENRWLKRVVAELALDNSLLKDVVGRKW